MSELKNKMKWSCACGAALDIKGQGQFAAAMLQNFINHHPCSLAYLNEREKEDGEEEERHDSATDSYHERRPTWQENSNERFGQETPTIIGFQPNEEWPPPVKVDDSVFEDVTRPRI